MSAGAAGQQPVFNRPASGGDVTADAYFWADNQSLDFTPNASLPSGQQSAGTLGRVDTIYDQKGGTSFEHVSDFQRTYLYNEGGGKRSWGRRNAFSGGTARGPFRVTDDITKWQGDFSLVWRGRCGPESGGSSEIFNLYEPSLNRNFNFIANTASGGTFQFTRQAGAGTTTFNASTGLYSTGSYVTLAMSYSISTGQVDFYFNGSFLNNPGTSDTTALPYGGTTQEWIGDRTSDTVHRAGFIMQWPRQLTADEHAAAHTLATAQAA